jgi:hypothetical protein
MRRYVPPGHGPVKEPANQVYRGDIVHHLAEQAHNFPPGNVVEAVIDITSRIPYCFLVSRLR